MKVVMVCRRYSGIRGDVWMPSGTPAVVKLIEELEARGHETTVLFLAKSHDSVADAVTDYGCFHHTSFIHIGWRGIAGLPGVLSDLVNDTRQFFKIAPYLLRPADIRYFDRAHLGFAAFTSLFCRTVVWRCLGVMSFVIAADTGNRLGQLYLRLARLLVRFPIRLMICTNDGSPWFRLFLRGTRRRLLLVTNGVDLSNEDPGDARRVLEGKPVIGFVGRATIPKGLDIFIDVCAELVRRKIAFKAVVVGDGSHLQIAREQAQTLGLGDVVEFHGSVPHAQVGSLYQSIDIYLSPARNGAFSNTTLEAIAAGCCVVVLSPDRKTQVDVTTEKFLPENVVFWADRADATECCADAVADLLAQPALLHQRQRLGTNFAKAALRPWRDRIREEADLLESLARTGALPTGAMRGDELSRIAFEAAG
jgi:glycosyltransferase involved in cell wall biosynthesis